MRLRSVSPVFLLLGLSAILKADEGMWLFNAPLPAGLKERYGFEASPAWLEHVQKSSVRFNSGGSGSFASADGLIITNHHVAADALQKLSDETHNYVRDGFRAKSRAEEIKCVDLELNVLMSMEDVTARMNAAVKPGMSAAEAFAARRAAKAEVERESQEKTGLRSDVITLYQGARYELYRYKRYTDVRLVFAPEQQAAFFGGDPDNFEFPRFDLDVSFFRAYENGQPAKIEHYLRWNSQGTAEGDLVFVSGHPGGTDRFLTYAELAYQRDVRSPKVLDHIRAFEVFLNSYSQRSVENARRARDDLFGFQNSRKAYDGRLAGLLDPALFTRKQAEEEGLKHYAQAHPELEAGDAWERIAAAQRIIAQNVIRYNYLELYHMRSPLFGIARNLYRAPAERAKPSGARLREFRGSNQESLQLELFSAEPFYDDLEQLKLAGSLTLMAQEFGATDPVVQAALAGKPPSERAAEIIAETKVKDVAERHRLYALDAAGMEKAADADPLLGLVRALDSEARAVRTIIEEQSEVKEQAHAKIEKVRYAKEGAGLYPDATFTLRLSYGAVKGYEEAGKKIPAYTTLAGLYERAAEHGNREPFDLSASWLKAKSKLKLGTPLNFVSTDDIIGGNSGSPVLNRSGEFIGIIFDGNLQSLVWDFAYTDAQGRSISVDVRAILEALRKVYGANALVDELLRTGK